jgi:hypothetical protein
MSEPFDKKAALRAYKEQKPRPGIYAVRNIDSGRAWADMAQNLDTTKNGLWHRLKEGRHLDKELQSEWNRMGEPAFEYIILEVLNEEMTPLVLKETLKAKKAEWAKVIVEG